MHRPLLRRLVFVCVIIALVVGVVVLQRPSKSSESAVVFSNMPAINNSNLIFGASTQAYVLFDVPVGPDYQLNAFEMQGYAQLIFGGAFATITARVHLDNAGSPGVVVVDLGSQGMGQSPAIETFTPSGAATLANGRRYWVVVSYVSGDPPRWIADNAANTPAGVFTFVDNGRIIGGVVTSDAATMRFHITLDADPIAAPPTGGGSSVAGCANTDGRLNSVCEEPWQTAAIYCRADGSIDVYGITDSVGWLAFRTTQAEIDAVGLPHQNALLERSADGKIRLYRLSTGEFQVNAPRWDNLRGNLPDGYVFIFDGCS